jgi:cell filamentation protein
VTFDPFGDCEKRGYLRNLARTKDPKIVRQTEHASFTTGLDAAFTSLASQKRPSYETCWGRIRSCLTRFTRGRDKRPLDHRAASCREQGKRPGENLIRLPAGHTARDRPWAGARTGQDVDGCEARRGHGNFAHGHPFLDSNSRTIMVLHCVLAQRAGFSIDWVATNKSDYLTALTKELEDPHKRHLDGYLKPFIKSAISPDAFAAKIPAAPGLDGEGEDTVLGRTDDPELKARYEAQELKRKQR